MFMFNLGIIDTLVKMYFSCFLYGSSINFLYKHISEYYKDKQFVIILVVTNDCPRNQE